MINRTQSYLNTMSYSTLVLTNICRVRLSLAMVDDIEHFYVVIVIRNCKIESRVVRQIKFHIFLIHIQNENNCDEYNNWESLTTLTVIAIILFFFILQRNKLTKKRNKRFQCDRTIVQLYCNNAQFWYITCASAWTISYIYEIILFCHAVCSF